MNQTYHKSVLLHETVQMLDVKPDGIYVDLTFGGGGHSREILKHLGPSGRLIGFDQDENAFKNAIEDERCTLIRQNFCHAYEHLIAMGIYEVDGVLADLGVSSFQFDDDLSGFSYRENISLDMRMDKRKERTAADILNQYSVEKLQYIFQELGEVRNAKTLANMIVEERKIKKFELSQDLNEILNKIKFGPFPSYAAPIYQALRMEVNQELEVLKEMLEKMAQIMSPRGRIAIITFHSLEDRLVKNYMKYGEFENEPTTDIFGKRKEWNWKNVTKKAIEAGAEELRENSRSRSARLRVMQKN